MSTSSTASARVQFGWEIVEVKGYRLQTTIEMGEIPWDSKSFWSDGIERAKIPRIELMLSWI